ncbi:TetR/AcrR family transcriptional regulator [Amycolatopsis sp. 195334CR]|uniref:TetR/AcrR family transcriptional regulator n=1 Tax=Amycolatopsis sp. 195334CR TaxID=2814588 RepID=UPI001A8FA315|nr:TetR/AcrR family transcriptional regulator [Amycolatopsis sp. 195334CR]MBN6034772.1 helix-turn-helix transcriptional regulator [Amycolatopsis sp. 195334CR]
MSTTQSSGLSGRRQQAAQNDGIILDAAREVFLADPKAPVSAVAKRAGVGISALYRRYPGKEDLLRHLCHEGLRRYNAEAEAALQEPDAAAAFTGFVERVVDADVHSLTVHLAGTFTPTAEMGADAMRANELATTLLSRAKDAGAVREDAVPQDIGLALEACSAIRAPDATRTRELRRRVLAMLLRTLSTVEDAPLPGPAPRPGELSGRWKPEN